MNEFELLEKQRNSGLEEGEIIISGIIFAGSKGPKISESVQYNFRTKNSKAKLQFHPPKNLMKKREDEILAVPKGASSWPPPPSSRRRPPVSQARTSVRALKHRIHGS